MILHSVAFLAGAAILAAVTHMTVLHTGGYGSPHSYAVIAVAAGVGIGSVCYTMARAQKQWAMARCLLVCIVAGELFGLQQTTTRLVAASLAQQTPLREYAETHAKAKADVAAAQKAVNAAGTSARLVKAEAAKTTADQAVTDSAKEMGCRINCRELLQKAVTDAALEVENARAEIGANKTKAETKLATAKATLAGMRAPESPTPLADVTGAQPWALDLTSAILGSVGGNGLACCLLVFGAHGPRREVTPLVPIEAGHKLNETPREHAARFALDCLSSKGDGAELAAIRQRYRTWSATQPEQLSDAEIGRALAKLFDEAGIPIAEQNGQPIAMGVALIPDPDLSAGVQSLADTPVGKELLPH